MVRKLIIFILVVCVVVLAAAWFAATYVPGGRVVDLIGKLDDPSPAVHDKARSDLREIGTAAVPELLAILTENDPPWRLWLRRQFPAQWRPVGRPRQQALRGLEVLGPLAAPAIPTMIARVNGRHFPLRADTVLESIGLAAVPAVCQAIQTNASVDAQVQLINVLAGMGSNSVSAVGPLSGLVADSRAEIRAAVAGALGRIQSQPEEVIPELVKLLQDADPNVRAAAAAGIGNFGPLADPAVPALMTTVYDHNASVRRAALNALLHLDNPEATLEALLELARDPEQDNRGLILNDLAKRDIPADALLELCTALKKDEDLTVRRQLPRFVKRLPPEDRVRLTAALLGDADQEIRITAGEMLGRSIGEAPTAGAAVSQALRHCDYTSGLALLSGLARCGAQALPLLIEGLGNSQAGIRRQAAFFIGTLEAQGRPAIGALAKALEDPDQNVRLDSLNALRRIDNRLVPVSTGKTLSETEEKNLISQTKAAVMKYAGP